MSHYQQESTDSGDVLPIIEDKNRRRVVKGIVCGLTAFTAYNVLPSKWGTPIIEQVFLPAHAATSGVLLSGNFSGTGSISLVSIGKRQSPNGLVAQIGTSIGSFFVSELHAAEVEEFSDVVDCCTSVEGELITYYLTIGRDPCEAFSGPVAGVATHTVSFDSKITAEIIEKGQESIRIRVTLFSEPDHSYTMTLNLSRSAGVCECPEIPN
ncbi:MAG: hypothetical protein COA36_12575 [Desulfotalea sp.]|nr:MAG: hypothetical protein COA36_12575 [Desulfotalea sp.]